MSLSTYARALPYASTVTPFGAHLQLGTTTRLDLVPAVGPLISVQDSILLIDGTVTVDMTDNLIGALGVDAGAAPAAAALLYHVYVSNQDAFPFPLDMRMSLTAPTLINGVAYLGALATNGANWRHVGWAFTSATPTFLDTNINRQVVSRYNPLTVVQTITPGYINDNAATAISVNSATYVGINGGTDDSFFFVGDGNSVLLTFGATARIVGAAQAAVGLGVGVNGSSSLEPFCVTLFPAAGQNSAGAGSRALQTVESSLYQVTFLAMTTAVATQFWADLARSGAAADPPSLVATAAIRT